MYAYHVSFRSHTNTYEESFSLKGWMRKCARWCDSQEVRPFSRRFSQIFSLFLLFLVLLRLKQIFLCTGTNFRKYITSYEYPMDIFGYAKLYKKSNVKLFSSRKRTISLLFPITIVSSKLNNSLPLFRPLFSSGDNSEERRDVKEGY